ncbi:MAG TPA: phosphoesterase, partial [Planctomycetes bacterium]|nr:phosphoesterase [Planctomycetota bacterium]
MEFVWVVPRSSLFPEATPNGFLALEADQLEQRFLGPARDEGFFIERRYAETHPEFKQPIPYVAICQDDKVLCLTRLSTQGEKRLHGKKSIGIGGHINPCDQSDGDLFANACQRELHEELILPSDTTLPLIPVGIINDDTSTVGAVHLGLVYSLDASQLNVSIRETDAMAGEFQTLSDLRSLA